MLNTLNTLNTSLALIPLAAALLAAPALTFAAPAHAPSEAPLPHIRALLLTGHNNHNWQYTSRVHEDTLEATGRFIVDVTDDPASTLADAAAIAAYQLFILDYNDAHAPKRWGDKPEANFIAAVKNGAGVVAIHSANGAFKGWAEYESMIGLMWREGAGHGPVHAFSVEPVDPDHPITKGLSAFQQRDELYHGLSNPQSTQTRLLARAMSAKDQGGTAQFEPMAFTSAFAKGRVFTTTLGHVWTNKPDTKTSILSPGFRALLARGAEWAATGAVSLPAAWADVRTHNRLSDQEKADGWQNLFDGQSAARFRSFKQQNMPEKGWVVRDAALVHVNQGAGGDIVTRDQYADFEFVCEWKAAPGANSGIMYRCTEDHDFPWKTGMEMQILDDAGHRDGSNGKTSAGSLYDLFAPSADVARPAGEWNHARVVAQGSRIQHWLNHVKIVDIDMASDQYAKAHAASKWPGMPDFGKRPRGHIALQDHGDEVAFRNIKVRELPRP